TQFVFNDPAAPAVVTLQLSTKPQPAPEGSQPTKPPYFIDIMPPLPTAGPDEDRGDSITLGAYLRSYALKGQERNRDYLRLLATDPQSFSTQTADDLLAFKSSYPHGPFTADGDAWHGWTWARVFSLPVFDHLGRDLGSIGEHTIRTLVRLNER